MNLCHRVLCRSRGWATYVETELLPWALQDVDLGPHPLELGPGPGRTTDWLMTRTARLTALEVDPADADALRTRLARTSVDVVTGDATAMPFGDGAFSSVLSFTMLHHVPSPQAQDRLLAEALRVLVPGGVFAGSDGLVNTRFRVIHLFDTLVPVDPATFPERLVAAGFTDPVVDAKGTRFRFRARRP